MACRCKLLEPIKGLLSQINSSRKVFSPLFSTLSFQGDIQLQHIPTSTPNNIVDTANQVRNLIEVIEASQLQPAFLFIDIEGADLSRSGSIAIIQVVVPPQKRVCLVDIHILKAEAFDTPSTSGLTLRTILESGQFPKVFFDIRNDSDALIVTSRSTSALWLICNSSNLQLLEFATRPVRGSFVKSLSTCISDTNILSWAEKRSWNGGKEAGRKLFAPERGGRYEVFLERPIPITIVNYCTQDVLYMPKLLLRYSKHLDTSRASQVQSETFNRILLSQSLDFCGTGQHMALGLTFVSKR
jgi:exonuclease 3'-5' domain-containing protein 1